MPLTDRLTVAYDTTYTAIWTFAKGQEFDQPYSRPTATTEMPGVDYGYNPLGTRPAAVAQTVVAWQFVYTYDATYPNWSSLRKGLDKAFAHGRTIILEKTDADGVVMDMEAICTGVPRKATVETMIFAQFTLSFEQRGAWKGPYPIGWSVYDANLLFDNAIIYDNITGAQFTTAAQVNTFSLVNNGNAFEYDAQITLIGPIPGPFVLYNFSLDVRGLPADPSNNPNPLRITINDTLASGDQYAIDNRTGAIYTTKAGVTAPWANILRPPGQHHYWVIRDGTNSCALIMGASSPTGGSFTFTYRDRYR